ncbi:unnamed protein product [Phyllotreta striolata]|uniref:phospholipase A2 n=1 Tax=Phyllotreta striolata TaxID=444603 RepID=A0A9N9TVJ1_PHYSR|nr:unnamed protein product [Phyllotreta striolata]
MLAQGIRVLRSLISSETPPNKVMETRLDLYTTREIHSDEDGLVLYLPTPVTQKTKGNPNYEIVLKKSVAPNLQPCFSLFRSQDAEESEQKFSIYKGKISPFVEAAKEMLNVQGVQKLCDALSEHPNWTLAHLAAHFATHDLLSDQKHQHLLNLTDADTGMSPLQVAVTTLNAKTVEVLVSENCPLHHLDHHGNSAFHYAANTTKTIVEALGEAPRELVNGRNRTGCTPLHLACLADKLDCVRALLLAGADVDAAAARSRHLDRPDTVCDYLREDHKEFYADDAKTGGAPLHWANSKGVIEALVEAECDVNAVNFERKTAMHVMIESDRMECLFTLLIHDANGNLGDKDGNRPIHLAVINDNPPALQALIAFGVDLDAPNDYGETPRHLITPAHDPKLLHYLAAVGAKRCSRKTEKCTEGCSPNGTNDGKANAKRATTTTDQDIINSMLYETTKRAIKLTRKTKTGGRLLCLDGGGIRGLVHIQTLIELEKVIGKPIQDSFDWMAGTSTGGVLALAIATGKTLKECLCLYFRLKDKAFVGTRPYSSKNLEDILKGIFGTDTHMADIKKPRIMITGALADRKPIQLQLFRTYESAIDILRDSTDELTRRSDEQIVWKVSRATGAAPTYFRAFGRYLDGGLIANNPTLDALTEIQEHTAALKSKGRKKEARPVTVVVSLGTGLVRVANVKVVDVVRPASIWDGVKLVSGISFLGTILLDQATTSEGRHIDRARAWCAAIQVPYFRFSPEMSEEVVMDEKSNEKLCKMLWETKVYMHEQLDVMKELAGLINKG